MADTMRYLIVKRDLYYRPNSRGYTGIKDEAGRFTLDEVAVLFPNLESENQDGMSYVAEEDAPEYRDACYTDLMARHAGEKIARITCERDAAQAEVARLTAALAEAERLEAAIRDEIKAPKDWPTIYAVIAFHRALAEAETRGLVLINAACGATTAIAHALDDGDVDDNSAGSLEDSPSIARKRLSCRVRKKCGVPIMPDLSPAPLPRLIAEVSA